MAQILTVVPTEAGEARAEGGAARRVLLGDVLVRAGKLAAQQLTAALQLQRQQDTLLGNILISQGTISPDDLTEALSQQSGLGQVDLHASPVEPELMVGLDPYRCLAIEAVPWRQVGGTRVVAIANPDKGAEAMSVCGGGAERVALALAPAEDIRRSIQTNFRGQLRADALRRCPERFSCRRWAGGPKGWRQAAAVGGLAVLLVTMPLVALQALMGWIMIANLMTTGLRLVALFAKFRVARNPRQPEAARLADYKKLPPVSVLVPLRDEERVAEHLLAALAAMDYPAPLLDVKLVLEEDDERTRAALARLGLPAGVEVITVPHDALKTKPRAMNYALPFCRGEIVGVYDAEDRPDPGQIRAVVAALHSAPPEVACVQGYLDFYNTGRNWLSRCFTIEYAIWFRVLLHGVQRLGIPIPLGGTSVFFRRRMLEEIGAWDAHNVTEDADLGMRLARFGYRCEMLASTTLEEATVRPRVWIRQRSRWLKGYAVTWISHMRRPGELLRDLGWRGFLGFQVIFLGAITSYLAIPLFWLLWTGAAGLDLPFWHALHPALIDGFVVSTLIGQAVMWTVAAVAVWDARKWGSLPWIAVLPFYWTLGAVAAYRAVAELFYAPFHWHKTEHGLGGVAEA
jgi:glycosyltransferase XagB